MKTHTLGVLTLVSMFIVGGTVYAVTPDGGFGSNTKRTAANSQSADEDEKPAPEKERQGSTEPAPISRAQFSVGTTVKVDGRLGHAVLDAAAPGETYVMLELRGDSAARGAALKTSLSIVIDKSGSMTGSRLPNAILAAETAVNRLKDGDSVSIIAFDTKIELMMPQTTVSSSSRQSALEAIKRIHLGGDTCISCGVEEGVKQLEAGPRVGAAVRRMLVLSDGKPTSGVRDASDFRAISERAMAKGVSITTVGLDVDFNEAVMTAIAQGSNGRHYFVENDTELVKVFEAEAATLQSSIASEAFADIDLGPGVEFVQLFDRTFDRKGSRISVPLGTFTKDEAKTVLLKVRVPAQKTTSVPIADVRVAFRDLTSNKDVVETGSLAVDLTKDRANVSQLDGVVVDRVQRSETAAALNDANSLFNLGKTDAARKRLEDAKTTLSANRGKAKTAAPPKRAADVDKSFESQQRELDRASGGFATPPPAPVSMDPSKPDSTPRPAPAQRERAQKSNAKRAAEAALPMGF